MCDWGLKTWIESDKRKRWYLQEHKRAWLMIIQDTKTIFEYVNC